MLIRLGPKEKSASVTSTIIKIENIYFSPEYFNMSLDSHFSPPTLGVQIQPLLCSNYRLNYFKIFLYMYYKHILEIGDFFFFFEYIGMDL